MTGAEERALLAKLAGAVQAVAKGADEALALVGPVPADVRALAGLDLVPRTAARALLKAVEQQQDVLARLFRALLLNEGIRTADLTARDIANQMEKLEVVDDAQAWADLVRLRHRLGQEYPVSLTAQLERLTEAAAAVPALSVIRARVLHVLDERGYLP